MSQFFINSISRAFRILKINNEEMIEADFILLQPVLHDREEC
jgi:hypothetical protein